MIIEIWNAILKIGSGVDASSEPASCSTPLPIETDAEERRAAGADDRE